MNTIVVWGSVRLPCVQIDKTGMWCLPLNLWWDSPKEDLGATENTGVKTYHRIPVKATTEPDFERQPKRVKINTGVQTNTEPIETPKCKDTKVKESIKHKISLHINLKKPDHTLKINGGKGDSIPNIQ